jgi:hypothetical protein
MDSKYFLVLQDGLSDDRDLVLLQLPLNGLTLQSLQCLLL